MRRVGDNPVTSTDVDELMRQAIDATRLTFPHPNPRVGAVLTSPEGTVRAIAAHQSAGKAHAEVLALDAVDDASGDTLYVTLEPCSHTGRTPPCTEAIINAGIARVVVGTIDPDPRVAGTGIERLRQAGIDVTVDVLSDTVIANDPGYYHHRSTGLPRVTLKLASTLDGQVAAADGTSRWISSPESREDAHRVRADNDVIIVGAGTVISDDPALNVRLEGYEGPQPRPVIISGDRPIPAQRQILERNPIVYEPTIGEWVDPADVVKDLGAQGYVSAMIEGGPSIAASFLEAGVVDQIIWYVAAKLAAGTGTPALSGHFATISDITDLSFTNIEHVGPDIKITATINKER
ncbi:MAG: bifunctional diaminohydroxyphosphoribosylaminopyrimidine deaminase/5-amino-6-(5-phosphoribosylamino)uracil reductase RibD [Actinomycetota bacterium]